MRQRPHTPVRRLLPLLVTAAAASAAWAAWLGWDRNHDVRADGTTTGPYAVWQVAGLVLTLLLSVGRAAARGHVAGAVLGTTAGLTAAAYLDWSDDSTGLFMVGVTLVMLGSLAGTAVVTTAVRAVRRDEGHPAA
ncbi:hypothetical protein D9753_16945 [Streptomyces dangxiongensis]|uniref:Integral membrane protein n=1 Tax=Streptomyces dangxiongensis TaxID=1442032 RepID=A0A3G2JDA9_9ACTN|nr:hypothetical protein [Streptomyces dangxiongensis]AYN40316.1 hypothetical protein D9753_16945 [Streptomyces dangxiongensis]